jgi:tyrosine-protein phosphatase SIW14
MCRLTERLTPRRLARWTGIAALLAAAAAAAWFGFWRYHLKRYQVLREGVLIRTGQPTELGLRKLVHCDHVRTVVTFRLDDPRLCRGLLDLGEPSGRLESEVVPELGVRFVCIPMGDEACWPWVAPWQFEEFFRLFDDPGNLPVAMHCVGGRHRTGTMAALFRMEYDRWPAERALREMESFDFDEYVPIQDLNLRTFAPRPRPDERQWQALQAAFADATGPGTPDDYQTLVHRLRHASDPRERDVRMADYLLQDRPFALALAARLIDLPDHPLAPLAARRAAACLERADAPPDEWTIAAALVADLGTADQQSRLLEMLASEPRTGAPSPRYRALVAGVTNRYTENRIPYLVSLLDDERLRPEPDASRYRYCDTAVARLAATVDQDFYGPAQNWDRARALARQWLAAHAAVAQVRTLVLPTRAPAFTARSDYDGRRD